MFDDVDISVNQSSSVTSVKNLDEATIHVEWSGTSPDGVLTVKARNGSGSWQTVDMGGTITITGNSGSHILLFSKMPGEDIQLTYNANSGTGNLTARISAKVVGA